MKRDIVLKILNLGEAKNMYDVLMTQMVGQHVELIGKTFGELDESEIEHITNETNKLISYEFISEIIIKFYEDLFTEEELEVIYQIQSNPVSKRLQQAFPILQDRIFQAVKQKMEEVK